VVSRGIAFWWKPAAINLLDGFEDVFPANRRGDHAAILINRSPCLQALDGSVMRAQVLQLLSDWQAPQRNLAVCQVRHQVFAVFVPRQEDELVALTELLQDMHSPCSDLVSAHVV
jgi:hypothetical protein